MKSPAVFQRLSVLAFVSAALFAGAHESHHDPSETFQKEEKTATLEKINEHYLKDIKPIFQIKCFDCHSSQIREPWYRNLPGAKLLIDSDIAEAKEHLDMDSDFPFKSHASPRVDLESIEDTVKKGDMPPLRYRVLHPQSKLTDSEKEKIQAWVQMGIKSLMAP